MDQPSLAANPPRPQGRVLSPLPCRGTRKLGDPFVCVQRLSRVLAQGVRDEDDNRGLFHDGQRFPWAIRLVLEAPDLDRAAERSSKS